MGVAAPARNRITRAGVGDPVTGDGNLYEGWYRRFLLLFGLLAFAVIVSVFLDETVSRSDQVIVAGTVTAMILWFWFVGQWHRISSDLHAVVYLLGNVVGITICIRIWEPSAMLLFAMYWFGFAYLHILYAMIYSFILTIATQWAFGTPGSNIGFNFDTLVMVGLMILLLGFSAMMARYIEAFQIEAERNKALVAELKRTQQSLIEREREAGVEQERRRMAGEIHDTMAQHFASIITNLRAANELERTNAAISRQHVIHAFSAAQQGLSDSRAMLSTMQPDVLLGRSLTEVLRTIVEEWDESATTDASFETEGSATQLTRTQESVLVRALQESLRNAGKHAQANRVEVKLTWLEDEMLLDISDDGVGFNPDEIDAGTNGYQMGLSTMESRVESAGGTFALESSPGEGTSITIAFPTGGDA